MSSSSSFVADGREAFAFAQLPPAPATARRIDSRTAQSEAQALLDDARAEADRIREGARAEGFAQGFQMGRDEAAARTEPAVQALGAALVQADAMRDAVADEMEAAAVDLALEIAGKAIAGALDADPARVVDVIRGALRGLVERERVTILVHPDDLEIVRESAETLVRQLGGIEHCEVQEERRVQRGGAIVRSATGEIDARIATKLDRARELLAAELSA
jgi:flagellar assembly protein FliH